MYRYIYQCSYAYVCLHAYIIVMEIFESLINRNFSVEPITKYTVKNVCTIKSTFYDIPYFFLRNFSVIN